MYVCVRRGGSALQHATACGSFEEAKKCCFVIADETRVVLGGVKSDNDNNSHKVVGSKPYRCVRQAKSGYCGS